MALIKCKECGREVSKNAAACPECGNPIKKVKQPRKQYGCGTLIVALAAVALFASLFDSGSKTSRSAVANKTTKQGVGVVDAVVKEPVSPWRYHVSVDEMDGSEEKYVYGRALNSVKGWLRNGTVGMGYMCSGRFYIRANDVGLASDDIDCNYSPCLSVQNARVRFDDNKPFMAKLSIWDKDNDGATFLSAYTDRIMSGMKGGNRMLIELEMFNTDGEQQMVGFDLLGFTKAVDQCL